MPDLNLANRSIEPNIYEFCAVGIDYCTLNVPYTSQTMPKNLLFVETNLCRD